jgi:3-hydroxyacyl-CoA dehydrogenase
LIVQTIGVVGCGQMGAGIAEAALLAGYDVIVYARNEDIRPACRPRIQASLQRAVSRGKLAAGEAEAAMSRLRGVVPPSWFRSSRVSASFFSSFFRSPPSVSPTSA